MFDTSAALQHTQRAFVWARIFKSWTGSSYEVVAPQPVKCSALATNIARRAPEVLHTVRLSGPLPTRKHCIYSTTARSASAFKTEWPPEPRLIFVCIV
jgi:hypothetical protein